MPARHLIFAATLLFTYQAMAVCMTTETSSQNKQECLKQAHFLLTPPESNSENFVSLLTNPASKKEALVNGSVIHCRYVYQKQNGQSAKFRCARTDENNQLYDSKDKLVPEASRLVSEGDDVYLADQSGKKLEVVNDKADQNDKKKFRKAHIMKVRYQDGSERNVENYTSSAASRMFWALGIPAHSNYMSEKVVCFGCGQAPFRGQQAALMQNGKYIVNEFVDAAIEVKFAGNRLYDPTQDPWNWTGLNKLHNQSSGEIKTEIEVLALASQFVGAIGKTAMQNAIVCTKASESNESVCEDVVAMAHDLGAAFGSRTQKGFLQKDAPRGDLGAYNKSSIFQKDSCRFSYSDGGKELPADITASGKAEFLKRAASLTHENLKVIFAASHMGRLQNLKLKTKISDLEDRWVQATENKLREIQQAPCN